MEGMYQNRPLPIDFGAFDTVRQHFSQFGLGVRTGIDLPNEQNGFKGSPDNAGQLMFQSIGQFDTYSTLQLAQYVSTIANGGYRMEPHMVKEIREPLLENELGPVVQEIQPKVLNRLDLEKGWIERVSSALRKLHKKRVERVLVTLKESLIHLLVKRERLRRFMTDR